MGRRMLCIRKRAFANRAPIPGNYYRSCGAILGAVFLSVAVQLALSLDATPPGTYRQRGTSSLQRLFRAHFPELVARYESEFATQLGKFRLERITKAVQRFLACGDYRRGIARIKCTNPDCGLEYFRPFSCSVFHLCPSCSQKRTLLLGEYMNERLLLRLPHRQFVFTPWSGRCTDLPKVLRVPRAAAAPQGLREPSSATTIGCTARSVVSSTPWCATS
jgi:hypothetical protein